MDLEIPRIEGRISMMKRVIIMTTNMQLHVIEDISAAGSQLPDFRYPRLPLSAAIWTEAVAGSVSEGRLNCMKYAIPSLLASLPDIDMWLIAAHGTYQADNRITRYNRLWKSLDKAGVLIPSGTAIDEIIQIKGKGLRGFGAVQCGLDQLEAIHSVMMRTQSALAILPKGNSRDTVESIMRKGWPLENSIPPKEIVEHVSDMSGVSVAVYGCFDDPEVSVVAYGKAHFFAKLVK